MMELIIKSGIYKPALFKALSFDYDGILADLTDQKVFDNMGLKAFHKFNKYMMNIPHNSGCLLNLFKALHDDKNIELHITTARSILTSQRVENSLKHHGIDTRRIKIHYLNGNSKSEHLKTLAVQAHFDDIEKHVTTPVNGVAMVHVRGVW